MANRNNRDNRRARARDSNDDNSKGKYYYKFIQFTVIFSEQERTALAHHSDRQGYSWTPRASVRRSVIGY